MSDLAAKPGRARLKVREDLGRRWRHFARRRADNHEELGSVGRGHDADNMKIAEDVITAVAEGELERVGHLATELEILAGMARGGKRIAAEISQRRPAGMFSGHGFFKWFSVETIGRIREKNRHHGRGTEVPEAAEKQGLATAYGRSQRRRSRRRK